MVSAGSFGPTHKIRRAQCPHKPRVRLVGGCAALVARAVADGASILPAPTCSTSTQFTAKRVRRDYPYVILVFGIPFQVVMFSTFIFSNSLSKPHSNFTTMGLLLSRP